MIHGAKLCHVDLHVATSDGSWRHVSWRHDVIAWRHRLWRQAEGPFFEIFPPGIYLKESFKKREKNKKDGPAPTHRSLFNGVELRSRPRAS
jgi:hypothetical protein